MSATHSSDADLKGKGKATDSTTAADHSMGEENDETSEDNESGVDDAGLEAEIDEADDDNMEEIDTSNILGSRTRRRKEVDYAAAEQKAKAAGEIGDEEDEEDDADFEEKAVVEGGGRIDTGDRMEE